ncbi:MAG: MCE family protein [Armatimonadetes bacterium]|nr:MCE family protein [Armatimonadota bacterium]
MRENQAVVVGLVVLLAAALLVSIGLALRGFGRYGAAYQIEVRVLDARGIDEDAEVLFQGVEVGRVARVRLLEDGPRLLLRIDRRVRPDSNDRITIVSPLIGFAPPFVEITRQPGGEPVVGSPPVYQGTAEPQLADLVPKVRQALDSLNDLTTRMADLTGSFDKLVGDPRLRRALLASAGNLERMSGNFVVASENFVRLTRRSPAILDEMNETVRAARRAAGQFERMVGQLQQVAHQATGALEQAEGALTEFRGAGQETRGLVAENRERLRELMQGLRGSLEQLNGTLADTRALVGNPELRTNLERTSANVRDASDTLRKIVEDVRGITGDVKVQEDLRSAVTGLRAATEEAGSAFRRINEILGRSEQVARTARAGLKRLGQAQIGAELVRGFHPAMNRLDVNAYIPWGRRDFIQLGLYDATESNKFNLQLGRPLGGDVALRYGLYASRLGFGLDFGRPGRRYTALNLYGLDNPLFDIRGYVPLSKELDLAIGVDRLFQRSTPVLGVRFRR